MERECLAGDAEESVGDHLAQSLQQSRAAVWLDMQPFVRMFSCGFMDLEDNLSFEGVEVQPFGNTQLVLIDPPYNIRRESSKNNSDHDNLFPDDMANVVKVVDQLLRPGGHGIVMCSLQQFPAWENTFNRYNRRQYASGHNRGNGKTFAVDKVPMIFVRSSHSSTSFPGRATCTLQSSAEVAVHLKKNGLSFKDEAEMVNYRNFNYVASGFKATTNVIDNVPGLAPGERLMINTVQEHGGESSTSRNTAVKKSPSALRPEQKSLPLLQELVSRFSQPGDIVTDMFAGTFSTAVACMSLPRHRVFVGCELDHDCFLQAKEDVIDKFALFASDPNRNTDIVLTTNQLSSASRLRLSTIPRHVKDNHWNAPDGLPSYQRFPIHVHAHLSGLTNAPRRFVEQYHNATVDSWPRNMRRLLNTLSAEVLLTSEAAACGLYVARSKIQVAGIGRGVFAAQTFHIGDPICLYYGTIVYQYLGTSRSSKQLYGGPGVMGVNKDRFNNYATLVRTNSQRFESVTHFSEGDRCIYIVPAPFCVGSFINDARYSKQDSEYEKLPTESRRKVNCECEQAPPMVNDGTELVSNTLLTFRATQTIHRGDELYTCYKRDYFDFPLKTNP